MTPRGVFSSYRGVILSKAKDLYRSFSPEFTLSVVEGGFRMSGRKTHPTPQLTNPKTCGILYIESTEKV